MSERGGGDCSWQQQDLLAVADLRWTIDDAVLTNTHEREAFFPSARACMCAEYCLIQYGNLIAFDKFSEPTNKATQHAPFDDFASAQHELEGGSALPRALQKLRSPDYLFGVRTILTLNRSCGHHASQD